jgi:hypothetical protein
MPGVIDGGGNIRWGPMSLPARRIAVSRNVERRIKLESSTCFRVIIGGHYFSKSLGPEKGGESKKGSRDDDTPLSAAPFSLAFFSTGRLIWASE